MKIVKTIEETRELVRQWRSEGHRIGFVPTMGFLHEGHLSLVDRARESAERTVLSIYVNPTQFGPEEDLDTYPRDFERDETLCASRGVDAVFYPSNDVMYKPDHSTWVLEEVLSLPLCGASRPRHFRGVTTVVTKLFNIVQPDVAVFGQKDAQQALVIQRMVRDLNIPVNVVVAPIVRESDGLAMSSRNRYLTSSERERALSIHNGLLAAEQLFAAGITSSSELIARIRSGIEDAGGTVDYIEIVSRTSLESLEQVTESALCAVAAVFGSTRLIDNIFLG